MEEFISEVESKIHLMPTLGFDERDDKQLIADLVEKMKNNELKEDVADIQIYIKGIMRYYGIIFQ